MSGTLYNAPSEIIAQLIDDLGLANLEDTLDDDPLTGWTVFPMSLPESPEQAVLVRDTAGRTHRRNQPTGEIGEHYGIQILARSAQDPATPYSRAKLISEYFDTQVNKEEVVLNDEDGNLRTYRVNAITRVGTVRPAGNDGRRFFFSADFLASIELVASADTGTGT